MDRGRHRGLRGAGQLGRDSGFGLTFLYTRIASRRRSAVRATTCAEWRRDHQDREERLTDVTLPILPVLSRTLEAGPCGDLTFIAGENGHPLTKESFGNLFRKACRAAGVRGSAHGVRKVAATRAANAGATVAELEAIFGWKGGTMAALYTRAADRRRLSQGAMHKLANGGEQTLPAPKRQTTRTCKKRSKITILIF